MMTSYEEILKLGDKLRSLHGNALYETTLHRALRIATRESLDPTLTNDAVFAALAQSF